MPSVWRDPLLDRIAPVITMVRFPLCLPKDGLCYTGISQKNNSMAATRFVWIGFSPLVCSVKMNKSDHFRVIKSEARSDVAIHTAFGLRWCL
jgi:hypothetical protein